MFMVMVRVRVSLNPVFISGKGIPKMIVGWKRQYREKQHRLKGSKNSGIFPDNIREMSYFLTIAI
jgi:hypothetical protein